MDRPRRPTERLSEILDALAAPESGSVSLATVVAAVGERSFGALLVLLGIPNVLAGVIPGLSIVLGFLLTLLSLQLVVAARKPWLPARLARLEIRRKDLRRLVERIRPHLRRLERGLRPRLLMLTARWAERPIGHPSAASLDLPVPI